MVLKVKRLDPKAVVPKYGSDNAAGLDLTAVTKDAHAGAFGTSSFVEYDTCLSVEIPEGYVGLLFPRSSVSNTCLSLANAVGVIDSDYRGSIKLRFRQLDTRQPEYFTGDRVGQLVIVAAPRVEVVEGDKQELSQTNRGKGGYGSTGR